MEGEIIFCKKRTAGAARIWSFEKKIREPPLDKGAQPPEGRLLNDGWCHND